MYAFCIRINDMRLTPFTPKKFLRRVFSQLWMLALQFILGMVLNLLGNDTRGLSHAAYNATLVIHILNAIGLLEGGIYIALKKRSRLSWWAAATITITFCGGVLTMLTELNAWSFVMACGFLASSWLYVVLYMRADRAMRSNRVSSK